MFRNQKASCTWNRRAPNNNRTSVEEFCYSFHKQVTWRHKHAWEISSIPSHRFIYISRISTKFLIWVLRNKLFYLDNFQSYIFLTCAPTILALGFLQIRRELSQGSLGPGSLGSLGKRLPCHSGSGSSGIVAFRFGNQMVTRIGFGKRKTGSL